MRRKENRGSHRHFGPMKRMQTPPPTNERLLPANCYPVIGRDGGALAPPFYGRLFSGGRGWGAFLGGSSSPHLLRAASAPIRTHPHAFAPPHPLNYLIGHSIKSIIHSVIHFECSVKLTELTHFGRALCKTSGRSEFRNRPELLKHQLE